LVNLHMIWPNAQCFWPITLDETALPILTKGKNINTKLIFWVGVRCQIDWVDCNEKINLINIFKTIDLNLKPTLKSLKPMASQPVDEGGQSPGGPRCQRLPSIGKYFSVGTLHTIFSHTAKFGFYFIAAFDPTPKILLICP